MSSIDLEIAEFEARIKQLRERKSSFQLNITAAETFIREKDIRIKEIREKISIIKTKISSASSQKESLKKVYL